MLLTSAGRLFDAVRTWLSRVTLIILLAKLVWLGHLWMFAYRFMRNFAAKAGIIITQELELANGLKTRMTNTTPLHRRQQRINIGIHGAARDGAAPT
jgi:hypothetical protein